MNPNQNASQGSPSPNAATRQPKEFAYQIGLWGTAGSGKTTYLTMLFSALGRSKSAVGYPDPKGHDFYSRNAETILDNGRFPPKTLATQQTEYPTFEYALYPPADSSDTNRVPIKLTFLDAPGEFYEDVEGRRTISKDHTIIQYLCECHGIIFLLDPVRSKSAGKSYRSLLENLLYRIADATKRSSNDALRRPLIEAYLAFCVSKIDVPDIWDRHKDSKEELLNKVVGSYVLDLIANQFCHPGRFEFFTLSSIGRRPGVQGGDDSQPNVELISSDAEPPSRDPPSASAGMGATGPQSSQRSLSEQFKDPSAESVAPGAPSEKIIDKEQINPVGVIEPLSWLISGIYQNPPQIVPKVRARS